MKRRQLIKIASGAFGASSLAASNVARALLNCSPPVYPGIQQCEAGIDSNLATYSARETNGQHMNQWCWAACIEMVFKYYGFNIPQELVVQQTWGGLVNNPGTPLQILNNLNTRWTDTNGKIFDVRGDVFTANPITAAQDLSQDRPLIIGTLGHAMVLSSLTYNVDQFGNGQVTNAVVRDPWPDTGRRSLSAEEWYSTNFLVRIAVARIR